MYVFLAAAGELDIHGVPLLINEVHNSGEGTGLTVWDGAVTLAKYLEHAYSSVLPGKTVVELGAGTGLAGIAASILGARHVILTDLAYALKNTQANVDRNKLSFKGVVECAELDW